MIDYEPLIALVKEAARTEKDAFYRYMFDKAADGANNIISEANAEEEQRRSFDDDDDDDDYEDDDYEDEDDEDDEDDLEDSIDDDGRCNCPKCRAKRAKTSDAYIEAGVEEVDENDVEYGWDEDDADEKIRRLPPVLAKVFSRLGPNGMADLLQVTGTNDAKRSPEKLIHSIGKLFTNYGLSKVEAIEFVIAFQEFDDKEFIASVGGDEVQDAETGSQALPTMTAEELKAARKQREKDLEKKKREANKSRSRR